jgi:hypothetical protein
LAEITPNNAPLRELKYERLAIDCEEDFRGHGLLRLREEEEQGDKESEADQTEERKSGDQGNLWFLWKANLSHWETEVNQYLSEPVSLPFIYLAQSQGWRQ